MIFNINNTRIFFAAAPDADNAQSEQLSDNPNATLEDNEAAKEIYTNAFKALNDAENALGGKNVSSRDIWNSGNIVLNAQWTEFTTQRKEWKEGKIKLVNFIQALFKALGNAIKTLGKTTSAAITNNKEKAKQILENAQNKMRESAGKVLSEEQMKELEKIRDASHAEQPNTSVSDVQSKGVKVTLDTKVEDLILEKGQDKHNALRTQPAKAFFHNFGKQLDTKELKDLTVGKLTLRHLIKLKLIDDTLLGVKDKTERTKGRDDSLINAAKITHQYAKTVAAQSKGRSK